MSEQNNEIYLNLNLVGVNKKLNYNYISMTVSHVEENTPFYGSRRGKGEIFIKSVFSN